VQDNFFDIRQKLLPLLGQVDAPGPGARRRCCAARPGMRRRCCAGVRLCDAGRWLALAVLALQCDGAATHGDPSATTPRHDPPRDKAGPATLGDLDADGDGQVSLDEFARGRRKGASETAFGCLDGDANGFVTRAEIAALRRSFYNSSLSTLEGDGMSKWLRRPECLPLSPADADRVIASFRTHDLNGMSLWDVAVKTPALLRDELDIHPASVRRTIVHAVCREIHGLGCLHPGAAAPEQPRSGADSFFTPGQDKDGDGRVSREEFVQARSGGQRGEDLGVAHAFWCLDHDHNGEVTRAEYLKVYRNFRASRLARLDPAQLFAFLSSKRCVAGEVRAYAPRLLAHGLRGHDLWNHTILNPALFKEKLGAKWEGWWGESEYWREKLQGKSVPAHVRERVHLHVADAVCNEIAGVSCLDPTTLLPPATWEGWWGGAAFWVEFVVAHWAQALSGLGTAALGIVSLIRTRQNIRLTDDARAVVASTTRELDAAADRRPDLPPSRPAVREAFRAHRQESVVPLTGRGATDFARVAAQRGAEETAQGDEAAARRRAGGGGVDGGRGGSIESSLQCAHVYAAVEDRGRAGSRCETKITWWTWVAGGGTCRRCHRHFCAAHVAKGHHRCQGP